MLDVYLTNLISDVEDLLKEEYSYFEEVIFKNLEKINKLNEVMLNVKSRLKENIPEWAWKS